MASVWGMVSGVFRWRPSKDMWPSWGHRIYVWFLTNLSKFAFGQLIMRKDGTVNQPVLNFFSSLFNKPVPAERKVVRGVYTVDITVDSSKGVWCRVFVPSWAMDSSSKLSHDQKKNKKLPLVLAWHGGGFSFMDPGTEVYDALGRKMARCCQAVVIFFSYRRAPEHKYPSAYDDGLTGFEWVRAQNSQAHEDFPIDVVDFSRVYLAGDSAGANLAHHVAAKVGLMDVSPMTVTGLIMIQPFFGGEERTSSEVQNANGPLLDLKQTDWLWRAFLPPGSDRDHPSSNVLGPKAPPFGPMNLPKILVLVGGKDPLMSRQIQYAEAMTSAGKDCKLVVFQNSFHGFYGLWRHLKAGVLLHNEIADFVNARGQANAAKIVVVSDP